MTVQATLPTKNAVFAGSAAQLRSTPKTWIAPAPPTQAIAAVTWRKSQNSYHVMRRIYNACSRARNPV